MDRLPDFDDLETLVVDADRKATVSPDATVRMPALNLPMAPPSTARLNLPKPPPATTLLGLQKPTSATAKLELPKPPPATAKLELPKPPPATAKLNLPKDPPPSAAPPTPKMVGDKTCLRPGGQIEAKTILRPSAAPEPAVPAPTPSTAKMRRPADSLPRTIVDFGGDKASVAPVALPTHELPSSPSAWPPITNTQYRVPRSSWPLTALTLVAVFASFVTLGAAIVAAWDKVPPGVAHSAASSLVLPPPRPSPSSSAALQPLTPSTAPSKTSAPTRLRDVRIAPAARPGPVSDNPYDDSSASASPPPPSTATAAPPAPAPADAKGANEADKKLEDLVRSMQR